MKKIIAISLILTTTACATITRGTKQGFSVNSEPSGAHVEFSSGQSCTTPCTLKVPRKDDFTLTINKDGYKEVKTNAVGQVSGSGGWALAGNIFLGGIIGLAVDFATGSARDIVPNPINANLEKQDRIASIR